LHSAQVVACGYAPEVLEPAQHVLNRVAKRERQDVALPISKRGN
jgi:hypothetical protein